MLEVDFGTQTFPLAFGSPSIIVENATILYLRIYKTDLQLTIIHKFLLMQLHKTNTLVQTLNC